MLEKDTKKNKEKTDVKWAKRIFLLNELSTIDLSLSECP